MARTETTARALALTLIAASLAACTSVPLVDPPTIRGAATPEVTRAAILRALVRGEYRIEEDVPGRVRGRRQTPGWFMTVDVFYGRDVSIRYADSGGLYYATRSGVPYIHRGYVARAQELLMAIQAEIRLLSAVPYPRAP